MSNTRNRIRIAGDLADPYRDLVSVPNGRTPLFPRARATRVDVAIYDNSVFQAEISQFTSLTLEIKVASDRTSAPLVSKTVSAAAFDNQCTLNNWVNGTAEHASFELSAAETAAFTVSENEQDLWLVVTAVSADGNVTLLAGLATAIEDGGLAAGAGAPAGDPTYYTADQVDAKINAALFGDKISRSPNGQYERRQGVTNEGKRIDVLRELT